MVRNHPPALLTEAEEHGLPAQCALSARGGVDFDDFGPVLEMEGANGGLVHVEDVLDDVQVRERTGVGSGSCLEPHKRARGGLSCGMDSCRG